MPRNIPRREALYGFDSRPGHQGIWPIFADIWRNSAFLLQNEKRQQETVSGAEGRRQTKNYAQNYAQKVTGTIRKRQRKKGIVYRAEICLKGHPGLSATFDRKSDAQRWIEDTEAALRAGGWIGNAPPGDMLFDDAINKYMDEVSAKKRCATNLPS